MLGNWSYNQACLVWQVCLLVKYNIKAKSLCVSVCVSLLVKKLILIYLWCTCWHHEFEMTGSAFSRMTTMIRILRVLSQYLTSTYMAEERITGSKFDLDLSAGSTCTQVYTALPIFGIHSLSRLSHQIAKFLSVTS